MRDVLIAMSALALVIVPAGAQQKWKASRTPHGQPDLPGVWTNSTLTPLERPAELAGKEFLTEKEAAEYGQRTFANLTSERRDADPAVDVGRSYNEFWRDRGSSVIASRRTELIVDPPEGTVPGLCPVSP